MSAKIQSINSPSPAAPPPSPIPTGTGSRSAAGSVLSEYIDKSIQIPELSLPQNVQRFKLAEINYYELLKSRENDNDSVQRELLRSSAREFGVFRLIRHGISTEELRLALSNGDRVFGLTTMECCTSYGDHEKIVWRGTGDRILGEASALMGEQNFKSFCQKIENVASELKSIAEELAKVIAQSAAKKQITEPIRLGELRMSIYRYHRANIIDRISSVVDERSKESDPYALSLHLLLESGEFCLHPEHGNLSSFGMSSDTIVVTIGKELEDWSMGELKSAQGKFIFKPYLHTSRPSFSIEQKWSTSDFRNIVGESKKIISLFDQILVLLVLSLLWKCVAYFIYF